MPDDCTLVIVMSSAMFEFWSVGLTWEASRKVPPHVSVKAPLLKVRVTSAPWEAVAPPHDYVASLRMLAPESRRQGLTAESLGPREMPAQFRDWWFGRFYPDNTQTLLKEADAAK